MNQLLTHLFIVAFIPSTFAALGGYVGRIQSAGVKGTLLCKGKPASNVLVKLYDDDRVKLSGLDTDDLMASGKTDSRGYFELNGWDAEFTTIDPKLNIYHDCEDGLKPCQRKISIMIPDGYISPGKVAKKYYDAGTIELAGKWAGETRDCIH
uniref:Transthyretin-like family protein n=1 Tax=Syphacia muris TaxID=451379 RepID=A0A0N5AY66_9BILA